MIATTFTLAAVLSTAAAPSSTAARVWPSSAPADCPFTRSEQITGVGFTGRHAEYTNADTWYPSWASDDNMYSPWTDGEVNKVNCGSGGADAATGYARIVGDDPLKLKVEVPAICHSKAQPYGGRYPCGSLVYDGVWYYGTYCLMNENGSLEGMVTIDGQMYNWGILGPFVGFRWSKDYGKTWTETPCTPAKPLFADPEKFGGPVKIGSPHFVDFGKNMQHSPDGKAYLVAHGAAIPDPKPRLANASWITGDCVYLLRVTPGIENMNDASKYEFYAGRGDGGKPIWSSDFKRIAPLVDWNNHCGCVTMTYNPGLKKYLMCVTDGWPTIKTFDTWILESDHITGPFKLVTYLSHFGEQAYFVHFPSRFISKDGRTAWLMYAANFTNTLPGSTLRSDPPGSRYGMCLQEVQLIGKDEGR